VRGGQCGAGLQWLPSSDLVAFSSENLPVPSSVPPVAVRPIFIVDVFQNLPRTGRRCCQYCEGRLSLVKRRSGQSRSPRASLQCKFDALFNWHA
jgi:hypothetical protein